MRANEKNQFSITMLMTMLIVTTIMHLAIFETARVTFIPVAISYCVSCTIIVLLSGSMMSEDMPSFESHRVRERLAEMEHERWARWYMDMKKTVEHGEFSEKKARWNRLLITRFARLPKNERRELLEHADKIMGMLQEE